VTEACPEEGPRDEGRDHDDLRPEAPPSLPSIEPRTLVQPGAGAVPARRGDLRPQVLALLDAALATELVCMLRYRRRHALARGAPARAGADEFLVHSAQEQRYADWLAERLAVDRYHSLIAVLGNQDPATRGLLEAMLQKEEEHAEALAAPGHGLPGPA
jgi:bacterioferritin (cytochrome b1)